MLLEAAILSLSADALVWEASLRRRVLAAAAKDVTSVGETFIRFVLGDATWEGFPVPIKQMFTDNGPAILAEVTGGFLRVDQAELGTIDVPTLLIAAAHSPEAFRQVIDAMADAMPNSRTHTVEGGHLINPADPRCCASSRTCLASDPRPPAQPDSSISETGARPGDACWMPTACRPRYAATPHQPSPAHSHPWTPTR